MENLHSLFGFLIPNASIPLEMLPVPSGRGTSLKAGLHRASSNMQSGRLSTIGDSPGPAEAVKMTAAKETTISEGCMHAESCSQIFS